MKKIIVLLTLILHLNCLYSQEERVENIYQKCLSTKLSKSDLMNLKRYAKEFEIFLIENKVLKDSTYNSYYNIFKSFSKGKRYLIDYKYSYLDSIASLKSHEIMPISKECLTLIKNNKNYKNSKLYKIQETTLIEKPKTVEEQLEIMLKFLNADDFKLQYYKNMVLISLQLSADTFPEEMK